MDDKTMRVVANVTLGDIRMVLDVVERSMDGEQLAPNMVAVRKLHDLTLDLFILLIHGSKIAAEYALIEMDLARLTDSSRDPQSEPCNCSVSDKVTSIEDQCQSFRYLAECDVPPEEIARILTGGDLSLEYFKDLPTIWASQTDDLKVDIRDHTRIWLSRMTVADGAPYDNQVTIERYRDGVWVRERQYKAMDSFGSVDPRDPAYEDDRWTDMTW